MAPGTGAGIGTDTDPGAVGFDGARLGRLDGYLQRLVDAGRLPGWQLVVTRRGRVAHASTGGWRHVEQHLPVEPDTLFRIYSMTKPITSLAAMMLYEQGAFELDTPVSRFLPEFADMRVYVGGSAAAPVTVPATEPIRMRHLLTHTSGLTYDFFNQHPVDELYRARGLGLQGSDVSGLAEVCDRLARLPLLFQPGTQWAYSMATDVLGRVVEVISGRSLAEFFAEQIFAPLGMGETRFGAGPSVASRLARLYGWTGTALVPIDATGRGVDEPAFYSGGGGLISSAHDYHRFTQLLLGGGALDGVRLVGPRTLAYMARNHLPGNVDLASYGRPIYAESPFTGTGFGLGFSVELDPAASGTIGSAGTFGWGGAASTAFWVDPLEQLTVLFFTQLMPSNAVPVRAALRQLVYAALLD
jgi:CubicO group peptidase (beta-lactamase class C family)